tara:strand:- start:280 stop:474 length:195 start_codon:yes stop_codon:yes gene_type:complete
MAGTTKVIVWTDPESGGLNITYPVGSDVDDAKKKAIPDGITSYIVNTSEIPTDRSFRNAWTYTE